MGEVGYKKPPKDKSWKKGQSGNPKGQPRKLPEISELLEKVLGDRGDGITRAEKILSNLADMAEGDDKNSVRAAEVLLNRGWGMPKQKTEVESSGNVTIVWKDAKSS